MQALELTRQQEITKQTEHKEKEAQAMAHAAQLNKVCPEQDILLCINGSKWQCIEAVIIDSHVWVVYVTLCLLITGA